MATFLLACAVLGGGILVLQLALGLFGHDADGLEGGHGGSHASEGFDLLTVRSVAAAVAFFGIAGRAALAMGVRPALTLLVALGAGGLAALGNAALMRLLRNFESDGVVRIDRAVGQSGRVHVKVPGGPNRPGKVLLTVQDRLLELPAVSLDGELPSGTDVTVVGLADGDTVEVVRTPDPGV